MRKWQSFIRVYSLCGGGNAIWNLEGGEEMEKRLRRLEGRVEALEKGATAATVTPAIINHFTSEKLVSRDPRKLGQELNRKIKSLSEEW